MHSNLQTLKKLKNVDSSSSDKSTPKLINNILKDFENNMNDDLNVKKSFDDPSSSILRLSNMNKEGKLSSIDAKKIIDNLRRIDNVLQILF